MPSQYDFNRMMCLDIFLQYCHEDNSKFISQYLAPQKVHPLMCFDVIGSNLRNIQNHTIRTQEYQELKSLKKQFKWFVNLDDILQYHYQTLVLTNKNQKIIWVNQGFKEMTGYSASFAIGKSPAFLQGKHTSYQTKRYIKRNLELGKPCKASILNYRKDQTEYLCDIMIFPLFNQTEELTHFIALENEII